MTDLSQLYESICQYAIHAVLAILGVGIVAVTFTVPQWQLQEPTRLKLQLPLQLWFVMAARAIIVMAARAIIVVAARAIIVVTAHVAVGVAVTPVWLQARS